MNESNNKVIPLFQSKQACENQQQNEQENKQEESPDKEKFSFEEIMKANQEKQRRLEKERSNANNKIKKNFNLKPKK